MLVFFVPYSVYCAVFRHIGTYPTHGFAG